MRGSERDFSGVATHDLRLLIERNEHRFENWVQASGLETGKIAEIRREKYQFTGLDIADRVCIAFGLNITQVLTVIPSHAITAALRMAEDEFRDEHDLLCVAPERVRERAIELRDLRARVLGQRTPEQVRILEQDKARAKVNQQKASARVSMVAFCQHER